MQNVCFMAKCNDFMGGKQFLFYFNAKVLAGEERMSIFSLAQEWNILHFSH